MENLNFPSSLIGRKAIHNRSSEIVTIVGVIFNPSGGNTFVLEFSSEERKYYSFHEFTLVS